MSIERLRHFLFDDLTKEGGDNMNQSQETIEMKQNKEGVFEMEKKFNFKTVASKVWNFLKGAAEKVRDFVVDAYDSVKDAAKNFVNRMKEQNVWETAKPYVLNYRMVMILIDLMLLMILPNTSSLVLVFFICLLIDVAIYVRGFAKLVVELFKRC